MTQPIRLEIDLDLGLARRIGEIQPIVAEALHQQRSTSRAAVTNVQAIIAEEVAATFKKELTAEIEAAKDEVRAAVKERAAAILAGTIVTMAAQS